MDATSSNTSFELNDISQSSESIIVRHHSYLDFNSCDSESEEKNDHNDEGLYKPETSESEREDELPNLVIENTIQKENIVSGN
ncbi:hypothetical protein PR048_021673 [Dryococelus australis]|uniref:Uncharacterized protein n=1 Tax=Dryococelus australis TaxID=614101 RepID=A0ABQ9GYV2_9NEOP|nr:hypothetical protein PR048_021673 [Dryococelus australis]